MYHSRKGQGCGFLTYTCGRRADDDEGEPVEPGDDEEVAEVERLVLEPGAIGADGEDAVGRFEEAIALALVLVCG